MRLKDAERTELTALTHDLLDDWYTFKFLDWKIVNSFNEFEFGNITEAVLAMLAKPTIFTKDSRVSQALNHTIGETSISHIIKSREYIHFLKLSLVRQFT